MIKKILSLLAAFNNRFRNTDEEKFEYVDLAPTDKADESGIYSTALAKATNNPNVSNIALTGPYGSGKSSIIKTFLKKYERYPFFKKRVLQISLAAFLPEADTDTGNVSKQEIERSILQQMLYGADANKLPLSRFKRIQSPKKWAVFVSLFIIIGLVACWHLIQHRTAIIDGTYFQPLDLTNWFNLAATTVAFIFIWQIVHQIYIKSFGVSLKSISLKDIQLTPESAAEESILNRHLDEIIYFFQSTKYDLVVVEDLDRFNNPDVFVTLREINSLINANAGVKRQIRFLYALRDNMFINTDRTKFFEFILPVIPIINSSNSIDKVIEQSERLSLYSRLDPQFLREVSRYLNDLRLIHNIFNEYSIYIKNLETDEENVIDPNKLLAVLIYKNVLPSDFEALHQEKGKLADILNRHDELIINAEAHHKAKISDLEQKISDADKQIPYDLEELRKIYAMALIAKIPQNYTMVGLNRNTTVPIQNLSEHEEFDQLIQSQSIYCRNAQNNYQSVNIDGLQKQANSEKTYQERKEEIERRSNEFKRNTSKTIKKLRAKVSTIRLSKFNEIIRTDTKGTEALFDKFGENCDLVRFLVLEGFLDDTYYQYTSLFHAGRLSPSDNKFLHKIRAFNTPEPDFQIDNPKEVIPAMREDDFLQSFALNTVLVDCILNEPVEYSTQLSKLISFIANNFTECDSFFSTYYQTGKHVPELISALIQKWPSFFEAALKHRSAPNHAARILAHLPEVRFKTLSESGNEFSEFLSKNLAEVLELEIDFDPNRLKLLPLEISNLKSLQQHTAITKTLTDEGLYIVSIENIRFAFKDVLGLINADQLDTKHYSTVLRSNNEALINKIEDNFDHYLKNILLALDNNSEENISTIIQVLNHDEIESEFLEEFINKQSEKVPSLENVPLRLHSSVFRLNSIKATWENCLAFVESENFSNETFITFLEDDATQLKLSSTSIDGSDGAKSLRQSIFNNTDMSDESYRTYIRTLPKSFNQFPNSANSEKLRIIIEEQKITFSNAAFDFLDEYYDHQVEFVAQNIETYLKQKEEFTFDDDFREKLLSSDISDDHQLKIVADMDLSLISSLPTRASIIGNLYHRTCADVSRFSAEEAQAMITNSKPAPVQVSILNMCQNILTDEQIEIILKEMPDPFPDFEPGYKQPTIPETDANIELVTWLAKRGIISSWKEALFGGIRIYNRRRSY